MTIRCPFCTAPEDERVSGVDETGEKVVLLMFACPFFYKLPVSQLVSDDAIQVHLNEWRLSEGDAWSESIGPVLKQRELKNIERVQRAVN